jgi:phosphoribosylamine--glycine ligase
MASRGYPASSSKGDVIQGLQRANELEHVEVFHAATKESDGAVVTSGGRVLTVTGVGDTFAQARARAYAGVARIQFAGEQYRSDIALRAERWEAATDAEAVGVGRSAPRAPVEGEEEAAPPMGGAAAGVADGEQQPAGGEGR